MKEADAAQASNLGQALAPAIASRFEVSLANCYAGPILPVMASESELALTFGVPVAVKRSDPRNALRWGNIE